MKRNTKTKTIVIATALATLLSATAVLANTTTSNTVETPKFSQTQSFEAHGWVKSSLDSIFLVLGNNSVRNQTVQRICHSLGDY